MANDYVALATITLGSTDTEIVFGSIPNTYRDLVVVARYVPSSFTQIRFNSDSSSIYNCVHMTGSGSVGQSGSYTAAHIDPGSSVGDSSGDNVQFVLQVLDYAQTNKHKSGVVRVDNPARYTQAQAFRYATTNAINTINLIQLGTFAAGSTFSLYGIRS